ncbi:HesB/YadR/YfhF family protein [Staphylococcus gallinarum]|uniref:HesB/YadR/YfhF family protein n=1 Tax=Staphylococcus gallinarum TaxID=1293 RepID=UPI002DBD2FB6|nr:HesB/YadR/YfhF family protein [Staphylococcus gallinarum]MEB6277038.1 HesB/YadR/YfhF family protein [Staphylococcus gallinarum]
MGIELSDNAVSWFKEELDLPEDDKVLQFFVRYGGEFQLKQGFSPAFSVDRKNDLEIGYENNYQGLNVVIAEKDLWYFQDDNLFIDVNDGIDEILYSKQ